MSLSHTDSDISTSTENYLCCLASSTGKTLKPDIEPHTSMLMELYPHANIYNEHKKSGTRSELGTFKIVGNKNDRKVILLFAQIYQGNNIMPNDNPSSRRNSFTKILEQLISKSSLKSLAFHRGQLTDQYIQMLDDFTKKYTLRYRDSPLTITIYNSSDVVISPRTSIVTPKQEPVEYLDLEGIELPDTVLFEIDFANIISNQGLIDMFPQDDEWMWLTADSGFATRINAVDKKLGDELNADDTFPSPDEIFNAFKLCKRPKVIILGMDPYAQRGNAHGLSFSVRPNVKIPVSLNNIYGALVNTIDGFTKPSHGCLQGWAEQGVLLLNSALTVKEGKSGSHIDIWESCTDYMIKKISEKYKNIVFVLWGNNAKAKKSLISTNQHLILEHSHPAARQGSFAKECKNFSEINQYLEKHNITSINWQL